MRIGCHISIRRGYAEAARTAHAIGASAFQFFAKNPRSLRVKAFDARDAAGCRAFCRENGLTSIIHAPYPVNLCAEDPALSALTVDCLKNDLEIAEACGSLGVVVHFGKTRGDDMLSGYRRMIGMLNQVLRGWSGQAKLLIENNAGQGSRMGTSLEELTQVRQLLDEPDKTGFCFDTCHAFASGLWRGDDWPQLAEKMRQLGYFSSLVAVHLNDSVYASGSCRDRHASIGQGRIGDAAFAALLATPELQDVPFVLETPGDRSGGHPEEMRHVRSLGEKLAQGTRM